MKATSPLMEHRRYHKHRSKMKSRKKNATTNLMKESFSKVNQQPRITERRLTNKSCFNLNGAISTSPYSRLNKGSNVKRGTVDFDLKRLLQDAKNKGLIENLGSASSCSTFSSTKGDSNTIDSPKEKSCREKSKSNCTSYPNLPLKHKHNRKEFISSTSPENDILLSGNDYDDSDCIIPSVHSKICQDQDPHLQGSSGSTTRQRDPKTSSETSIPKVLSIRKRPSWSTRLKFAGGIVDSLVLEKKKLFPNENICFSERPKNVASNLTDRFRKTHFMNIPTAFTLESDIVCDHDTDMFQQNKVLLQKPTNEFIRQETTCTEKKNDGKEGCEFVTIPDLEKVDKDEQPILNSDNYFKQKRIEAWVKAIHPNPPTENIYKSNQIKALNKKIPVKPCETNKHQTETDFLCNLKKNTVAKSTEKNPFKILAKPKPLWTVGEEGCCVSSPVLPPVPQQMSSDKKSCPSDISYHLNSIWDQPSKRAKIDLFNNWQKAQSQRKVNSPIATHPSKQKSEWFSWFKSRTDHKIGQRDSSSSEDQFIFNPPAPNKNQIQRNYDEPKKQGITTFAKPTEIWGKFPKIAKWNDEVLALTYTNQ